MCVLETLAICGKVCVVNCECHNMPKVWQKDSRRRKGGYMRCILKHVTFRMGNHEYRYRETRRKRGRLIQELDAKIATMIERYPFLKEVLDAS